MNQTPDPRARLVQHRLNEAQQALEANELTEAQKFFEEALSIEGVHPNRASDIRQALKKYSERAAGQTPPDWESVHQVMDLLDTLKLQNDETRAFQRELQLQEAKFLLETKDSLNESFNIFANLMTNAERLGVQDKLKANIAQIICAYVSQRAAQQQWSLLSQVFEKIQKLWPPTDSIHDWLAAISHILTAANQTKLEASQARQYAQRLNYILIGITVLAIIAYPLAFILS